MYQWNCVHVSFNAELRKVSFDEYDAKSKALKFDNGSYVHQSTRAYFCRKRCNSTSAIVEMLILVFWIDFLWLAASRINNMVTQHCSYPDTKPYCDCEYQLNMWGLWWLLFPDRLEHDGKGMGSSWYVDRVVVENVTSGREWMFDCGRWIDEKGAEFQHGQVTAAGESSVIKESGGARPISWFHLVRLKCCRCRKLVVLLTYSCAGRTLQTGRSLQ